MIYRIDETTSTNDEARDAKYRHGDIVWAERQTAARMPAPDAASGDIRGPAPKVKTSPSRWCSNPGSFPSGSSSCSPKP